MAQRFIKGYTNNHLTWVMVDATDFATPESALSAATAIKIYGKVKGSTGVHFVSSGAGSLTNDIQHVGANATGIYTIALAKADLSDASQAWYDQYVISISATGAAYQTLIVDGGIMESYLSNVVSYLSNIQSNMSGIVSDTLSAAAQGNSRVLLVQSRLSDLNSVYTSDISDIKSMLTALSGLVSDAHSAAVVAQAISASDMSDLRSAIAAGPAATITASDISDIASAVWANTIGARVDSRVVLNLSRISDVHSLLTVVASDVSDLTSRVTGAVATASDVASKVWAEKYTAASNVKASTFGSLFRLAGSRVSDIQSYLVAMSGALSDTYSAAVVAQSISASDMSDIRSAISAGPAATVTASDISDIASAVWAHTVGARVDSRVLVVKSDTSDIKSALTAGVELGASSLSDIRSAITANAISASDMSDIASRVGVVLASDLSDIKSGVAQANSRLLVAQSQVSDIYSLLSDVASDVGVMSGILSDVASAVLSAGIKKNSALNAFEFLLVDSADHVTPITGRTVTATRSIDGGAFGACSNAVSELSNGIYVINLSATDLNGTIITLRFTATGADDRIITLKTQP